MKYIRVLVYFLMLWGCSSSAKINRGNMRILVFSKTQAFRHASIADGKMALLKLGITNNWLVDTTEDAGFFTTGNLSRYRSVVFLNTSGDILNDLQQKAFETYMASSGGFVGIHAATDTEKDWPWYNDLVGAYFKGHPKPQYARYQITNKIFPAVAFMADTINRFEEIYDFYNFKKDSVNIVMTVDETSYTGGIMGTAHPAAWYHQYKGGKAFYTAWGHHSETFKEELFLKHIAAAITWTSGQ